jgi:hypothetical protein
MHIREGAISILTRTDSVCLGSVSVKLSEPAIQTSYTYSLAVNLAASLPSKHYTS